MKKTIKLALAFLREHPVRFALTTAATSAAVCMVIWMASSYEALHQTYDEYANLALGRYELAVAPISMNPGDSVPDDVAVDLADDDAVAAADPMWAKRVRIHRIVKTTPSPAAACPSNGEDNWQAERSNLDRVATPPTRFADGPGAGPNARMPELLFLATDAPASPFDMLQGKWLDSTASEEMGVVVRSDVAKKLGLDLNDQIVVETPSPVGEDDHLLSLHVIGVVGAPSLPTTGATAIPVLAPSSGEAFITAAAGEKIFGETKRITLVGVSLAPSTDVDQFRFRWSPRLSRYSTPVQFQEAYAIEEALDQAAEAQNVRLQSYMATGVALLAALLVVSCTLSMGVTERSRQYVLLRAITLTRRQVGSLIVVEAAVFATAGFFGGVLLGLVVLRSSEAAYSKLLYHGVPFGVHSLTLALMAAYGGAFLASIIPAWRAMRVRPIDATAPPQWAREKSVSAVMAAVGLLLIAINPLLTFVIPHTERSVFPAMAVGYASMMLGFVLLAPAVVALVDRWCSPVFARALAIDPKLLASQLTAHLWRSVGAAVAMAFGMGLFIAVHVWGSTMLQAFIPGAWTPDAVIALESGLSPGDVSKIASLPDVDADRCLPLVVEQPRLWEDVTGSAERPSVTRQDSVVIVGLDPVQAFSGDPPLLALEWVAGDPSDAIRKLRQGRACVVPDHFLKASGLSVGDSVAVVPPRRGREPVDYLIAGAVRLPGWHWQTKLTGMRPRTHRAAAMIFADYASVAHDFDLPKATHVWFSYAGGQADPDRIQQAVLDIYARNGELGAPGTASEPTVRVVPVQSIRDHIQAIARRWIWLISQAPLIALLITCFGVLNVMLASVRSRYWEFGVLRAVGFTRFELVRAVLAEGLLIASAACLLGLGFGVLAGWCGSGVAQYVSFFGGLNPPIVVPWGAIALGLTLVLLLGLLTALWPAAAVGRTRPLELLRQGTTGF